MKSAEEKIIWVLEFCQADIAAFSSEDWLSFILGWQDFIANSVALNARTSNSQLRKLQHDVRQCLEEISRHLQTPTGGKWALTVPTADLLELSFQGFGPGRWEAHTKTESFYAAFFFSLGLTLTGIDTDRIRQCLSCTRLFFAEHGRQRFCSPKCKGRHASQRFRERHSEKLRTKAHAYYEKKVREKTGRPQQGVGQFRKAKTAKGKG